MVICGLRKGTREGEVYLIKALWKHVGLITALSAEKFSRANYKSCA